MNPEQQSAVHYLDGPLLVLAGAGSGKTRVITQKIAYLIEKRGYGAENIAAITFTNRAANEMQERVTELLGSDRTRGLTVSTFHSLGMQILRRDAARIGYKPGFSVFDSADSLHVVSEILKTTDIALAKRVIVAISRFKNAMISPSAAGACAETEDEAFVAACYQRYQDTFKAYQAMDFDDLIRLPVELFEFSPEVLERWSCKLRYLLIDEYQDTNSCQYRLIRLLSGSNGQFTAVGDDDQAIYAWRGASAEHIQGLGQDYPSLKVIKLEQNYRSTARILRSANRLIANNPKVYEKKLWSDRGLGEPIDVLVAENDEQEAEMIVRRIELHRMTMHSSYSDYAILYRGNHQARIYEQSLRDARIPYVLSGGNSFFDRMEIRGLVSWLRILLNTEDNPAFIRAGTTPRRGIGTQTLEKLGEYASERGISLFAAASEAGLCERLNERQLGHLRQLVEVITRLGQESETQSAAKMLNHLVETIGYQAWLFEAAEQERARSQWKNVCEFMDWLGRKAEDSGKSLKEMTQTITLASLLEGREENTADAVRLSTLHAAKGLEFAHVFMVGVEEGLLPHRESVVEGRIEEERRLMYVGITRAQKTLTLSYCRKRRRARDFIMVEPSRFIDELHGEDLRHKGKTLPIEEQKIQATSWLDKMHAMVNRKD
ncbi:MAG: UvrD-helicase domain-containing protein [Pseudomonadota bacterium]|nr:UvrD-helicase domain-containing protein [Pseudomonadota bacterium]